MPRAIAARDLGAAELVNAALDSLEAEELLEAAQWAAIKDTCPVCGVAQEQHWTCACCGMRCHTVPRSTRMEGYCSWCVAEGCAERHAAGRRLECAA